MALWSKGQHSNVLSVEERPPGLSTRKGLVISAFYFIFKGWVGHEGKFGHFPYGMLPGTAKMGSDTGSQDTLEASPVL